MLRAFKWHMEPLFIGDPAELVQFLEPRPWNKKVVLFETSRSNV